MFSPFGNVTSPLTASSPATSLSPKSSQLGTAPSGASLPETFGIAPVASVATPPRPSAATSHDTGVDMKHLPSLSPSTLSTLISGGMSLASHDSGDDDGWEIDREEIRLGPRIGIGSFGKFFKNLFIYLFIIRSKNIINLGL